MGWLNKPARITGIVNVHNSGRVIKQATIMAHKKGELKAKPVATTDDKGEFSFELEKGIYNIYAYKKNYTWQKYEREIKIRSGKPQKRLELTLKRGLFKDAVIFTFGGLDAVEIITPEGTRETTIEMEITPRGNIKMPFTIKNNSGKKIKVVSIKIILPDRSVKTMENKGGLLKHGNISAIEDGDFAMGWIITKAHPDIIAKGIEGEVNWKEA